MAFEDFKQKDSLVIVYTGEGKGKTSASMGLMSRALGTGWSVAFLQFIKHWDVGEHHFIREIKEKIYKDKIYFFKGGEGFYHAGELSAKGVSDSQHHEAAVKTFKKSMECVSSGKFEVVICDEINNAVHDGLLEEKHLLQLIEARAPNTTLCLTGRNFPKDLLNKVDIATNMTKIKHHFDDKYLANKGIDY
jgi:cob(I)alamin adenosyltransferase